MQSFYVGHKNTPLKKSGKCGAQTSAAMVLFSTIHDLTTTNVVLHLRIQGRDYITKELYKSLVLRNVVPIVHGGASYSEIATPNSSRPQRFS